MTFEWDYEQMIKQIFSNRPWSDRYIIKKSNEENSKWKMEIYNYDKNGTLVEYERHKRIMGGAECWSWKSDGTLEKHYLKDYNDRVVGEYEDFISNEHGYIEHDYGDWTAHDKIHRDPEEVKKFKYMKFDNWS